MTDYTPDLQGRAILMASDFLDEGYDKEDRKEEKIFLTDIESDLKKLGIKFYLLEFKTLAELKEGLSKFHKDGIVIYNWADELYGRPNTGYLITQFFDQHGYIYSGASTENLILANDRCKVSEVLAKHGVSVPKQYELDQKDIVFPIILKAKFEHGSFGMSTKSILSSQKELDEFKKGNDWEKFLGEQFIDGAEYTISVWGNKKPEVLTLCDIRFESNANEKYKIIDNGSKWDRSSADYLGVYSAPVDHIDPAMDKKLRKLVLDASKALNSKGFIRYEVRVDAKGIPYIIDYNPNPNFWPGTAFIKSAQEMGYNLGEIVARLCQFALDA